jgi:hypothetical protein
MMNTYTLKHQLTFCRYPRIDLPYKYYTRMKVIIGYKTLEFVTLNDISAVQLTKDRSVTNGGRGRILI